MTAPTAIAPDPRLQRGRRLARSAFALGAIGFLFWILGAVVNPRQAFMSYLAVYSARSAPCSARSSS